MSERVIGNPELLDQIQAQHETIAELERKLAEQQAEFKKLHEFVRGTELDPNLNGEELNTLLAAAREEGRKEAVPEGWQVVPKEPTLVMLEAGDECLTSSAKDVYESMLDNAPEVKP